jgi:glutathione S-transferase
MSNELKLYHSAASPNSRRVRIFLAEKGIALPLVPVDLAKGEQHTDAYRAINPRRVVPTLVLEDGTAIGEVPAIWRYLEEVYPTPPLLGSTPKDKALVAMWERRAELEGFAAVMEGVRNAAERLKGRAIAGPHRDRTRRVRDHGPGRALPRVARSNDRPLSESAPQKPTLRERLLLAQSGRSYANSIP